MGLTRLAENMMGGGFRFAGRWSCLMTGESGRVLWNAPRSGWDVGCLSCLPKKEEEEEEEAGSPLES